MIKLHTESQSSGKVIDVFPIYQTPPNVIYEAENKEKPDKDRNIGIILLTVASVLITLILVCNVLVRAYATQDEKPAKTLPSFIGISYELAKTQLNSLGYTSDKILATSLDKNNTEVHQEWLVQTQDVVQRDNTSMIVLGCLPSGNELVSVSVDVKKPTKLTEYVREKIANARNRP